MIDWRRGGWTGSLSRWVRREVDEQLRDNPVARRVRYGLWEGLIPLALTARILVLIYPATGGHH